MGEVAEDRLPVLPGHLCTQLPADIPISVWLLVIRQCRSQSACLIKSAALCWPHLRIHFFFSFSLSLRLQEMLGWYPKPVHRDIPRSHFSSMLSSGNSRVFQLPWAPPGRAHRPSLLSENAINTISPWGYGVCYFFFPISSQPPLGKSPAESESEVTQSCPTLCNSMDCSLPGFSVHGIFQARVLEWVAFSFSRGSSQCRDQTQVSCIAGRRFTFWVAREAGTRVPQRQMQRNPRGRMLPSIPSSLGSFSSLGIQNSQTKEWPHGFLCPKWLHSLNFQNGNALTVFLP